MKPEIPVPVGILTEVRVESVPAASVVGPAEPVAVERAAEPMAVLPEPAAVDVL